MATLLINWNSRTQSCQLLTFKPCHDCQVWIAFFDFKIFLISTTFDLSPKIISHFSEEICHIEKILKEKCLKKIVARIRLKSRIRREVDKHIFRSFAEVESIWFFSELLFAKNGPF